MYIHIRVHIYGKSEQGMHDGGYSRPIACYCVFGQLSNGDPKSSVTHKRGVVLNKEHCQYTLLPCTGGSL